MNNLNYGVIGNCKSAALVSQEGAIDWACMPDFNSSSVFASLLDQKRGGHFRIITDDSWNKTKQIYIKNTNILLTSYSNGKDSFEVIDFMPRYKKANGRYHNPPDIIRLVRPKKGTPEAIFDYDPKLGYARNETITRKSTDCIKSHTKRGAYESVYLYTSFDFDSILQKKPVPIKNNHFFLIGYNQKLMDISIDLIELEYEKTKVYWMDWVSRTHLYPKYNDLIKRSALVLKLLSFQQSGALLAAVTTSLPETIGEVRNWDYRFCWIRDASMIVSTITKLGHKNTAERFLNFVLSIISYKNERMQIMYGIRGEKKLTEYILNWLDGYENSKPVRIGNAAYLQKQNDIYGILLDLIHQAFVLFGRDYDTAEDLWTIVRSLTKTVVNNWRREDMGIWELRSQKKHFVFSKVLCWVAMDRAIKIAELLHKDEYIPKWRKTRNIIKDQILTRGWNDEIGAFTQAYGSRELDAANLLMAHYNFIEPDDPKYHQTVMKTREELVNNGLMYRYKDKDDFGLPKSSFTICTFWLISSLALIGKRKEAGKLFKNILSKANHVGLYSEDIDFETGRLLGNFPQGYSHLALINTAISLADGEEADDSIIEEAIIKDN